MNIGVKAYPKKGKEVAPWINSYSLFLLLLSVYWQSLLKLGLAIKGLVRNTKNAIKLLYQVRQYLVFFIKK